MNHILIKGSDGQGRKPMIVLHGLFGGMKNWRTLCQNEAIAGKRDCYLVELRNHANSDHHEDMNYDVLSDDIIRFADEMGLKEFTLLGHSLGGRTAMTTACRFPDRVDGVISIDIAPRNDTTSNNQIMAVTKTVINFMNDLLDEEVPTIEGKKRADEYFKRSPELA